MTSTDTLPVDFDSIESIAAEFDLWREDDETDAELAERTIASLQESVDELEAFIARLRELSPATPPIGFSEIALDGPPSGSTQPRNR